MLCSSHVSILFRIISFFRSPLAGCRHVTHFSFGHTLVTLSSFYSSDLMTTSLMEPWPLISCSFRCTLLSKTGGSVDTDAATLQP